MEGFSICLEIQSHGIRLEADASVLVLPGPTM
jgi:hypothetical protein